jgi:type III secretion system FlhB-like substrate exporter
MESGRIRFGNKKLNDKGKEVPNKLTHPLLTSPDRDLIDAVAATHGTVISAWPGGEGQWQTEVHGDLDILVPVAPEPVSQWWERWSGGGCMRRCDGITDQINDAPCDCDKTADKRACSATTRITVLLPETGDARWRIETKSLYAAIELPASLERAQGEKTGEVIPGVLSVEQRPGKKGKVPVPVIRLNKIQSGAAVSAAPEQPEGVAPSGGRVESPEPDGGSGSGDSPALITEPQRRRLMAKAREHNVSTEDAKMLIKDLAGVTSSKDIPADKYETVISAVENWAEWQAQLVPERQEDVG